MFTRGQRPVFALKTSSPNRSEQGSLCASEHKFPQPRVTIGSGHEQVRSAPHGVREDHLRDRRAVRHHAFHVEMHTVPRQFQGDVGTGLFPVSAASGRIHDQRGDRLVLVVNPGSAGERATAAPAGN